MFIGTYKFYLDGKYVGEQKNSITRAGRSIILKSLLGTIPTVGGEIHIGIGATANGSPDSNGLIPDNILNFDIGAAPVRMSYLDNSSNYDALVFKARFGSVTSERYRIYELGLFPGNSTEASAGLRETSLFSGSVADGWQGLLVNSGSSVPSTSCYITSALTSYTFRVGDTALFVKAGETVSVNVDQTKLASINLDRLNSVDTLAIAYSKLTADAPTVTVRFKTTSDDYFTAIYTLSGSEVYGISTVTVGNMTTTGNPNWANINSVTVTSTTKDVVIDAIRFNDIDTIDTAYGMVSRAVLSTPIVKESNSVLDIEYYLSMGFNKTVI